MSWWLAFSRGRHYLCVKGPTMRKRLVLQRLLVVF